MDILLQGFEQLKLLKALQQNMSYYPFCCS
jgi:hypothetical protein